MVDKPRTSQQNRALHLWFQQVADELNGGGYNVQLVIKEQLDVDWTGELVKELLWRMVMIAVVGKRSTTELKKHEEIDTIYDTLNRHLGEKFGIHVAFPNERDFEKIDPDFIANK